MSVISPEERSYKQNNKTAFFIGDKTSIEQKEELLAATQQRLADMKLRMKQDNGIIVGKRKESYNRCIENCNQLISNLKAQLGR